MTLRKLTISNAYDDGTEVTTTAECEIDGDLYVNDPQYREDVEQEDIFALTGTGKTDGNSYYEVDSIDGLEPVIHVEFG